MKILFLILSSFFTLAANAHIRSKSSGQLVPRSTSDSMKTAPCGGVPRTATSAQFAPGATITVSWDETINHPGRFEIYFSPADDANWQLLKSIPDTTNNTNDLPHQYSTTVTLPATPCAACTIQLIQVMEENPANPSYYYSCSDIKIQSSTSTTAPPPVMHADPCN